MSNATSESLLGGRVTFPGTSLTVHRIGYGAMQLAGPGVWGPPKDPDGAIAVLRQAVAAGVNHIDTSDFYGPHVTNQIIREALHPYPDNLVIVTKIGARRGADASWLPAFSREELTQAVHDNLRNLGLDALEVVNFRAFGVHGPVEGSIEAPLAVLAELQRQGLVRHVGLSNVTRAQIAEGRKICDIVCVQNLYNVAHRADDALIDELARDRIAYAPFFPLGVCDDMVERYPEGLVKILSYLHRKFRLPIYITEHGAASSDENFRARDLRENLAAVDLALPDEARAALDEVARAAAA